MDEQSPLSFDEEVFGNIYINGVKAGSGYAVTLDPFDAATSSRLFAPFSSTQDANPSNPHVFGWYDPAGGGGCGNLTAYVSGDTTSRYNEVHGGSGKERHCVRPGKYWFGVGGKGFLLDYVQTAGNGVSIANSTAGVTELIEALTYNPNQTSNWVDHVVHVDLTPGNYSEGRVLDIDNAYATPLADSFSNDPNPAGSDFDVFRFSAARSSSGWSLDNQGRALVRLYWDFGTNKGLATGYYDAHSTEHLIRHHQFKDHVFESRNVQAALELMRPDEAPEDTQHVATRVIAITRVSPIACATFEATSTRLTTDQVVSAGCSSTGSNTSYRWRFDDAGSWTDYSTSPDYEFMGHSSSGTHIVTVEARNVDAGVSNAASYPFSVSASQVLMDGRVYVTDKATNQYTANVSGDWFERYTDYPTWWPASGPDHQYGIGRIWPAGDYSVDLREEVSNPLGRGRLHVTICNPCQGGELAAPMLAPRDDSGWEIFGAGPWLTWGAGRALRLYDLAGQHDAQSPFTTSAWFDADSGSGSESGVGSLLSFRRHPLPMSDARAFEFSLSAFAEPVTLGFAVDPDLGPNPADDLAGYDATRGMVYVFDDSRAVGFMLRGPAGRDALRAINQYGAHRPSPRSPADAWQAQRTSAVRLLPGRSDVQLLLTAATRPGPASWVFVVVRASSVSELQLRADQALASLGSSWPRN